jgi:hypothetical protein
MVGLINADRPREVTWACPDCSEAGSGKECLGSLATRDAESFAELSAGCEMMRGAIAAGRNLSALVDRLPSPVWYPRLLDDPEGLRLEIRRQFGRTALAAAATVDTPIGVIKIDDVYENHFFDVDPATGKDRRDPDHVFFIPVVRKTLDSPVEIWEIQDGGRRSRRLMFLKLYILEDIFAYHLAVVTRDLRLLTAHRINGLAACQARRKGRPLFMAY